MSGRDHLRLVEPSKPRVSVTSELFGFIHMFDHASGIEEVFLSHNGDMNIATSVNHAAARERLAHWAHEIDDRLDRDAPILHWPLRPAGFASR